MCAAVVNTYPHLHPYPYPHPNLRRMAPGAQYWGSKSEKAMKEQTPLSIPTLALTPTLIPNLALTFTLTPNLPLPSPSPLP